MPRPKCTQFVGIKIPYELDCALEREADRRTAAARLVLSTAPAVTKSDVIKDCCEFRLSLIKALRIGFYTLQTVPEDGQSEMGLTVG